MARIGLVAIGRNEGERLRRSLLSVIGKIEHIVYVDSASTDGSVELARSLGVNVVELDPAKPFASPRSRNEGFDRLLEIAPELEYVQFVDGDCELVEGWIERGIQELDAQPEFAIVSGRRQERFPEISVYNRLADIEWDTPLGEVPYCHGDAMMRVAAFKQAGGFNPTLIGGGEPELCVRIRRNGWKIFRVDAPMTWHDADIHRFGQWWKRNVRVGHAYAEGSWLHGRSPERHWVKESRSIWLWGLVFPVLSLGLIWPSQGWSLILCLLYPIQILRLFLGMKGKGYGNQDAFVYGWTCVIGKFPLVQGQLKFYWNLLRGKKTKLVEYKDVTPLGADS
ncbi:MAG: glycosyltransferase family 2 protein [Oscillatoriales cyanobacterium RM2_1_1]|nr:glycosyltransferase family 2 protein [Oscillatoriales cyanobacterium SM2_3_0]NJO46421.1 glycosyltransferase family 2 protein [Oscillatoriales cyanobacterium RM2_1_1]